MVQMSSDAGNTHILISSRETKREHTFGLVSSRETKHARRLVEQDRKHGGRRFGGCRNGDQYLLAQELIRGSHLAGPSPLRRPECLSMLRLVAPVSK